MFWQNSLLVGLWTTFLTASLLTASCAKAYQEAPDADTKNVSPNQDADIDTKPENCTPSEEQCNGKDDDCDGEIDEGFGLGAPCDSDDNDACLDDKTVCSTDGLEIVCMNLGPALPELCNGIDDDCRAESLDGTDDPGINIPCDGIDSDLCKEGTSSCSAGSIICSDETGSTIDLCNGTDDDCDPSSSDGSEDARVGGLCDGPDGDLCNEGTNRCNAGVISCTDTTNTTIDLCNGVDDDCDPLSSDGSEDPQNGLPCDGPDGDLCNEGVSTCSGGSLQCSDTTNTSVDLCNGVDDDCDPSSADGAEDSQIGIPCDGPDTDLCNEGISACMAGVVQCSDTSGNNVEICNRQDDDCDGQIDEGFSLDTNPICTEATFLGSVSGDNGTMILTASEGQEHWYRVRITENQMENSTYLSATVRLDSPSSVDYDLFVYCENCANRRFYSSERAEGLLDTVEIRRNDRSGDVSFDILIEVRFIAADVCANWDLTVTSDTSVDSETCPF